MGGGKDGKGKKGDKDREKGKKGKGKSEFGKGKGKEENTGTFTELHVAAKEGDLVQVAALLADEKTAKELLNTADQHKRTPLHLAAFFGKAGVVQKLLEAQADIHNEAMDGFLPLHFAAQQGHLEVIQLLTRKVGDGKHGAVRSYVNRVVAKGKRSALHLALQKGHTECARFLVMKGASTTAQTAGEKTALDLCQTDELRKELGGAAHAAAEAAAGAETAEAADKEAAEAAEEPAAKRARIEAEAEAAADAPPPAAALVLPGVLACGPFSLPRVEITCDDKERTFPAGVGALANVHWAMVAKSNPHWVDSPVLCVNSQVTAKDAAEVRTLRLKTVKTKYKLVEYTNFSEEGKLLPPSARCNHCGVMVFVETSDGYTVLAERAADAKDAPGQMHSWPSGRLESTDLGALLKVWLAEDIGFEWDSVQRLRVLGLLEAGKDPLEGRKQELVVGLHVAKTAAEVLKVFQQQRASLSASGPAPGPVDAKAQRASAVAAAKLPAGIAFVAVAGPAASGTVPVSEEDGPKFVCLEGLLAGTGKERLTGSCSRALELLRTLKAIPS